ncbi:MAG TPA: hypothetical protein VGO50_09620 [Pyrinomonadaceae bacterium]|nr:hypothetical protein [Pyrinomonadaceae bacterium]
MNIRKILLAMLAVLSLSLSVSPNSFHTSSPVIIEDAFAKCRIPPFREAYTGANTVFTGKIIGVVQNERGKTFEFQMEKYWKGRSQKKVKVTVYETTRYQAIYQMGKRYLVFASAGSEGDLRDGRCSRSNDIANAAADLKALGKGKMPR